MMTNHTINGAAPAARRWLWIIVAVSVALRLASALYQGNVIEALPGVTDQLSYHELANRLLDGHGFSFATGWWPATRANQPTAHWSFLYVLFIAAIYSVFGPAPLIARLAQAFLTGILHPLLVWRIGNRLFGPAAGLASAAVTAIYGYFVFYGGALVTESLFFLAFLWVLDIVTAMAVSRGDASRRLSPWVQLGFGLAAAMLLRQAFLLMVPPILAWLAWRLGIRRSAEEAPPARQALAIRGLLALAIFASCILPWTIRNYRVFGEFVPLNTNAGFVFFWANHPVHGNEFIPILPNGPVNYMTLLPREFRRMNEAQLDRALLLRGVGFVKDDPIRYVRLSLSRAREYFKFWPSIDSSLTSNSIRVLSFGLFAPFLFYGVFLSVTQNKGDSRRDFGGTALLLLVAALYTLVHLLTWTLVRYRLPVDAIMMPFVGVSMVSLFHRFSMRQGAVSARP
jgi:hypothetical protein